MVAINVKNLEFSTMIVMCVGTEVKKENSHTF